MRSPHPNDYEQGMEALPQAAQRRRALFGRGSPHPKGNAAPAGRQVQQVENPVIYRFILAGGPELSEDSECVSLGKSAIAKLTHHRVCFDQRRAFGGCGACSSLEISQKGCHESSWA